MATVTFTIPDELSAKLEPYHENLDELLRIGLTEVKKGQALALFKKGNISLWKAARLAGVSLREMNDYAVAHGLRATIDEKSVKEDLS